MNNVCFYAREEKEEKKKQKMRNKEGLPSESQATSNNEYVMWPDGSYFVF